jgi:hypothetical protein
MRPGYGLATVILALAFFTVTNEADAGVAGKYFAVQEIPFLAGVPAADVFFFDFDKKFYAQNTVDVGTWKETNYIVLSVFQASIELKSADPPTTASIEFSGLNFAGTKIIGIASLKDGISTPIFLFLGEQK